MGRGKDLTDSEKKIIITKLAKLSTFENIAKRIKRHVVTVKRFINDPLRRRKTRADCGSMKSVSKRDLSCLKRNLRKNPGATSATIFKEAGLPNISKSTRNRILAKMAENKSSLKRPPLTERHKKLRLNWAKNYMKTDMKCVLFTDESRATLNGPDGWSKGWVLHGDQCPIRMRRQQGGGGVMIWAGIVGDEILGPVRVPEGVKITSHTYCQFLKRVLEPWLEEIPLSLLRKIIYMHDNAPSHSAKATTEYLESLGFNNQRLMIWPPNSPDLNPIENLWSIMKRRVYADGKQYTSKDALWKAIKQAAASIPSSLIRKLTDSVNERLFDIIRLNGSHVSR
jgi:transposase